MYNQTLTVANLMFIWIYIYKEDIESLIDALEIKSLNDTLKVTLY
jgi:hypothetical protein